MHDIEARVVAFLDAANAGEADMPDEVIVKAGRAFRKALQKQFNAAPRRKDFRMSIGSVGKPTCQLQAEKLGWEKETPQYSDKLRNTIGDVTEIVLMAVLEAAGVEFEEVQGRVSLPVSDDTTLNGYHDVKINGEIWDIKSASPWAFANKFDRGFEALQKEDAFGYIEQGFGYAEADNARFAGWLVVNKSTGEICVTEVPEYQYQELHDASIQRIKGTVATLDSDAPFERCFEDQPETFRKKSTGNRVLGTTCGFCQFKQTCWPGLQYLPDQMSKAASPTWKYYTHVEPKEEESAEE